MPKPLEHGRSLIVIHKVKYSKANQAQIRSSNKTSDLTPYISAYTHTHTEVLNCIGLSEMPQKGRDKSTSFQHFPTGHLLLRISSVVSWVLEQMEWTCYSVQPREQKFLPPSKPHYCIGFCTSGKKRQTFQYFMPSDSTFHLPRGAFRTCWCCFWGLCSGTPFHGLENAPSAPEWHKFGYCWPEVHSDPEIQSCDLSWHLSSSNLGETETSWALCWPEMLLFYTRHMGGTE